MNTTNPLENLRDIHLPETVSSWPPAPGWWLLALLILSCIGWVIWKLWKNHQQKHLLRLSLASLEKLETDYVEHQDSQRLIRQYSSLLKRVALARFPRQKVASLNGSSWLKFLDQSAETSLFNSTAGQLLINAPYQRPGTDITDIDQLTQAIKQWFEAINSKKLQPTTIEPDGSQL